MGLNIGFSRSTYDDRRDNATNYGRAATYNGYQGWNGQGFFNTGFNQNPNPYYFKIKEFMQIGSYLAVKICYPDCKNYEGNKILVYDGVIYEELSKQTSIDPHFSTNKKFKSPIARFEPTDQGWVNALKFCSMLQRDHIEIEC